MIFLQGLFSWSFNSHGPAFSHGLFARSFLMVFSHGLFSWSFLMVFSHGLFSWSFLMVFSHGLFSWSFLMVFSHGLFSWSFLMVFSHGLCCLFMAWSLATPISQGRPRITFTVEVERHYIPSRKNEEKKRQCKKTMYKDHKKRR